MDVPKLPHHERKDLCTTRAPYRQGRKLTAVKVYTIADESVCLLITKVPDLKLEIEVANMCRKFGIVEKVEHLPNYPHNQFETTYLVKYRSVRFSRRAKKIMDEKNFFGGILHVCYAPELETVNETRSKLRERKSAFLFAKSKELKKESRAFSKCNKFYRDDVKTIETSTCRNVSLNSNILTDSEVNLSDGFSQPEVNNINNMQNSDLSINLAFNSDKNSDIAKNCDLTNNKSIYDHKGNLKILNKKYLKSNNVFKRPKKVKNKNRISITAQPILKDLEKPLNTSSVKIK